MSEPNVGQMLVQMGKDAALGAAVRCAVRDKTVWKDGQFHSWLDWADTCIALGAAVATALEAEKEQQHE